MLGIVPQIRIAKIASVKITSLAAFLGKTLIFSHDPPKG